MGERVVLTPPAVDLADQTEPVPPSAEVATELTYEDWNDDVLTWGRSMRAALARVRAWVAANAPTP